MREMNEQAVLETLRRSGPMSRAEICRDTGLSKPTVQLALSNVERAGLVRSAGRREGLPGPAAQLFEIDPNAGYVLSLDVGGEFLRGALGTLTGAVLTRTSVRVSSTTGPDRVNELISTADAVLRAARVERGAVIQTVLGSPGMYRPDHTALALTGGIPGWDRPEIVTALRDAFGSELMIENDIDVAALAEHTFGHGRNVDSLAFLSIGTGVGLGLVIGGRVHRGAHGAAGEVGFLPMVELAGLDRRDARRRGDLEAAASAAGVVRRARRLGLRSPGLSAQRVFAAAADGDLIARRVVLEEAELVAKVLTALVVTVDPELIVLGGGIGRAEGFVDLVRDRVRKISPVEPTVLVTALGEDAVVDGAMALGVQRAWQRATDSPAEDSGASSASRN
jgi:predicted NBD/HSP70 family sugar kinase